MFGKVLPEDEDFKTNELIFSDVVGVVVVVSIMDIVVCGDNSVVVSVIDVVVCGDNSVVVSVIDVVVCGDNSVVVSIIDVVVCVDNTVFVILLWDIARKIINTKLHQKFIF